jgi:hypothetical protein
LALISAAAHVAIAASALTIALELRTCARIPTAEAFRPSGIGLTNGEVGYLTR